MTGAGCSALALVLLGLSGPATGLWAVCLELALLGVGLGQLIGQLITEVQQAAPAHQLGVATTGVRFFQTLGSALGAALFGTVLARAFEASEPGRTLGAVRTLTGAAREHALGSFTDAVDVVFLSAGGVMALVLVPPCGCGRPGRWRTRPDRRWRRRRSGRCSRPERLSEGGAGPGGPQGSPPGPAPSGLFAVRALPRPGPAPPGPQAWAAHSEARIAQISLSRRTPLCRYHSRSTPSRVMPTRSATARLRALTEVHHHSARCRPRVTKA